MRTSKKITIAAVVAVIVALAAIGPSFIRAYNTPASAACINNLRLIDGGKQQWALENPTRTNYSPTLEDLRPYIGHGPSNELPRCPQGGTYIVGRAGVTPKCSIGGPSHTSP